jgi:DLP12 prophage; multidrug resistance protein (possible drug resistance protein)
MIEQKCGHFLERFYKRRENMNPWLLLGGSIGLEVIATNLLKLSDGFTKPLPTISALLIYALSFYLVSIVFRSLPVGLVYAVWSGVGIILTAMVAYFAFGQKLDMPTMLGIALIISGVLVINLFSTTNH